MFFDLSGPVVKKLSLALKRHKLMMCAAESCTGGLIAAACTNEAGSSAWFSGGVVTYTNDMKMRLLKVPVEVLREYGAVSLPVVRQMSVGACKACAAQCAIAVSGIAGPDGGTPEKPVGTVCLAVAVPGGLELKKPPQADYLKKSGMHVFAQTARFDGGREEVRQAACLLGLEMLLHALGR